MSRRARASILIATALAATGCKGGAVAPAAALPPAPAARYVPPADRYVRSVLLDFESPLDATFVEATDKRVVVDATLAANHVLEAAGTASIRLGALVRGREFPGAWDLVGVRFFTTVASRCDVSVADGEATIAAGGASLAAGRWRTVWLDLGALAGTTRPATSMPSDDELIVRVASTSAVVGIDDVVLAQSRIVVAQSSSPRSGDPFCVARAGAEWRATLGERTLLTLPAAPFAEDGYRVVEADAARVVFRDSSGDVACVDRQGRVTRGGDATPSPAAISIVDGAARVERNLPGDRDNDGFDESRGCYAIRATGGRFTFRIDGSPTAPTSWPTVDVVGLAAGEVSVWVEGQSVPSITRAADGRTTIELPLDVQRPIDVQVRMRE